MVAPHHDPRLLLADQVQGLVGVGPIAHQVAQEDEAVDAALFRIAQHDPQRLQVRVEVREDEVHGSTVLP